VKPTRPVFVVGGAHTKFIGKHHPDFVWKGHPDHGKRTNPGLEDYLVRATRDALADTGIDADAIDRAYVGNFAGECFSSQGHLGAMLAGIDPGLDGKPIARLEGACASGGLAIASGLDAIAAGADLVLVVGVEVQTTVSAREGADFLARAGHYETQRSIDPFMFPCLFARRARAYREAYGVDDETLGAIVVKAHHNAARNPLAHLHAVGRRMSLEVASRTSDDNPVFLEHADLRDHLRLSDCSPVSDGASALVLASEDALKDLGRSRDGVTEILAQSVSAAPLQDTSPDPLRLDNVARAAKRAYESAGIAPDSVDVAEVHDCFAIAEAEMMEALGFADAGEGASYIASGQTAIDGKRPVNTGGGLIGFGHPVGATGVKQVLEISRQLLGKCEGYQISGEPRVGISANMGGDDRTAVVIVQGRD
jgi:acetyl-CoA acyltransferase